MRLVYPISIVLLFILAFNSYSQNKQELQKFYESRLNEITDSAIGYNNLYRDTVKLDMDTAYFELIKDYYHFKDSVLYAERDSLNLQRKDSVNFMAANIKKDFDPYFEFLLDSLNNENIKFAQLIAHQKELNLNCPDCKDKKDYEDALDDYRDLLDSLTEIFEDNYGVLADTLSALAEDSLEGCKDELLDYTQDMVDAQSEEHESKTGNETISNEKETENNSELDLGITYDSHDSYNGRDNGTIQSSIAPSIQYIHKSGFGAFFDLKYLSKAAKKLNDVDLGISYQTDISEIFNLFFSYTHYWFNDSTQVRATLNNTIEGMLSLETKHFNSNITMDYDFGGGVKEFSTTLYGGFPVVLSKKLFKGTLTFEPGLTAAYGEQNSTLALRRRVKGRVVNVPKLKNTFGVLDYEIWLPFTLETKHLIVKPGIYVIIPVNVIDLSAKKTFGNFSLDVTVPITF